MEHLACCQNAHFDTEEKSQNLGRANQKLIIALFSLLGQKHLQ